MIQYFITLIIFINIYKIDYFNFFKKFYIHLFIFLFSLTSFLFLFYPILWVDPFLIIETFTVNASHFNNVGTTTLGEIMYAANLPSTYLIIWLAVKIPVIILLGIILIPVERKIFEDKKRNILWHHLVFSNKYYFNFDI